MKKRVADIVVETLIENNIKDCFSVVGGGAMHLNNAFVLKKDAIKTVYNHHEQACSMAAEGYARLTGRMAAVCVTSGPGGINALNGVQGAWVDSIPMIVISGHPRYATTVAAAGLNLRSRGVQENDIVSQAKGITKYAKIVVNSLEIKAELEKAIKIAMSGRRGPVWIDLPLDVQGSLVEEDELVKYCTESIEEIEHGERLVKEISTLNDMLKEAKRPCILTGSGIRAGDVYKEYQEFIKYIKIPIVGGAVQPDINCNGDEYYYGMSGSIGPRCGNFILQSADFILVLGNSLAFKQTGFNQEAFAPKAKIVMVNAEEDESKKPGLHIDLSICTDLKSFFDLCKKENLSASASKEWLSHCDYVKNNTLRYEMLTKRGEPKENERVSALYFWREFLQKAEDDAVIALGNSNCIVGVLQEGVEAKGQRVLVNYNSGSMGDDLPEAIGAAVACKRDVYCVTGDGSIMMNIQEFQTIKHYKLPVKTIIFNNNGYGAIRATCSNFFDGLYTGCDEMSGVSFPDFEKVAIAFDIPYRRCMCVGELKNSIDWIMQYNGACVLEIYETINEEKGPKLASKMDENGVFVTPPLHDMSPFLAEDEMKKYLID